MYECLTHSTHVTSRSEIAVRLDTVGQSDIDENDMVADEGQRRRAVTQAIQTTVGV